MKHPVGVRTIYNSDPPSSTKIRFGLGLILAQSEGRGHLYNTPTLASYCAVEGARVFWGHGDRTNSPTPASLPEPKVVSCVTNL